MLALLPVALLLLTVLVTQRRLLDPRGVPQAIATEPWPTVAVVVPARNETASLPSLLTSLRHLRIQPHEVVVVDDGSDDGTAEVARAGGATVLPSRALPPGWTGKAWACQRGAYATTGQVLLFLDADTALAPGALDGLLRLHAWHGGLVSVQPFHEPVRPYEQLSAYFNVVSLMASGAIGRRPSGRPMAFGPCLMTSRADYVRVGGHAAVRSEVLDDAMLAAAYTRAGLPVHCALGDAAVRMRMYPSGWRQLVEGWTKNVASGAAQADRRSAAAAALWLAAHWAVAAGAVLALAGALTGSFSGLAVLGVWAAAWLGVALQLRHALRRTGSFRWWTWAFFPLPLLAFTVVFVRSWVLTRVRHEVRWRGRTVRLPGRSPSRQSSS